MKKSAQWFDRAKKVMPGGVNSPVRAFGAVGAEPPYISRAAGQFLWDTDGNRYLDMIGSWGAMFLGHAHLHVTAALREAIGNGLSYGCCCPQEVELAETVCRMMPSLDMVRMVSSGTEAVMSAIRAARGYTGRDLLIKFEGCYHGHSDALLSKAGSGLATAGLPGSAGVPQGAVKDTLTLPYNDKHALETVFQDKGEQIAAVILEPIAANMGVVLPETGFLETARDLTTRYGAVLIFDEVITGFRVSSGGAQGHFGISPDLTTLGKIVGGGLPVGAYGGKREIMQCVAPLGPVYQAGTLSGNPAAMTAGLAALKTLESDPDIYRRADELCVRLAEGLSAAAALSHIPVQINRAASLMTLFFTDQPVRDYEQAKRSDTARYARFFRFMLDRGIYFAPSQYEAVFLSDAHTARDVEEVIRCFELFLKEECL